ncbi:rhomboid family intramembrane serine protease [Allohahella marinimesophila]|uniref:GlpG protein n=1 Tax=Allohahella marinimesophila TaxID=1054972 RepID=A0ABP7NLS4_9GAMM
MFKALELDIETDISALYESLRLNGVPVRVIEQNGLQSIWVEDEALVSKVREAFSRYSSSAEIRQQVDAEVTHLRTKRAKTRSGDSLSTTILVSTARFPLVWLTLALLLLVGAWTGFGRFPSQDDFYMVPPSLYGVDGLAQRWEVLWLVLMDGQVWRPLSPALTHLGVLHLVGNALGLFVFGRAIELMHGRLWMLLLMITSALVSNLAQYLFHGAAFAGFSGVVYALVGVHAVALVLDKGNPVWGPSGFVILAVVGMAFGLSNLSELFDVYMADTAHFVGFLSGVLWQACSSLVRQPPVRGAPLH